MNLRMMINPLSIGIYLPILRIFFLDSIWSFLSFKKLVVEHVCFNIDASLNLGTIFGCLEFWGTTMFADSEVYLLPWFKSYFVLEHAESSPVDSSSTLSKLWYLWCNKMLWKSLKSSLLAWIPRQKHDDSSWFFNNLSVLSVVESDTSTSSSKPQVARVSR
jgi:hypothetical protein